MGITEKDFYKEISAHSYFQGTTDILDNKIQKKCGMKIETFKENHTLHLGGTKKKKARINSHRRNVHANIAKSVYPMKNDDGEIIRNIYEELLYVSMKVKKEELQIHEGTSRYNLKLRGYIIAKDRSDAVSDHEKFMEDDDDGPRCVYAYITNLKYKYVMNLIDSARPYVPKKFQLKDLDAIAKANKMHTETIQLEGETHPRYVIDIGDNEKSKRSYEYAEKIKRDIVPAKY